MSVCLSVCHVRVDIVFIRHAIVDIYGQFHVNVHLPCPHIYGHVAIRFSHLLRVLLHHSRLKNTMKAWKAHYHGCFMDDGQQEQVRLTLGVMQGTAERLKRLGALAGSTTYKTVAQRLQDSKKGCLLSTGHCSAGLMITVAAKHGVSAVETSISNSAVKWNKCLQGCLNSKPLPDQMELVYTLRLAPTMPCIFSSNTYYVHAPQRLSSWEK